MTYDQIAQAARLWRAGQDTLAIAQRIWGSVHTSDRWNTRSAGLYNREALVYRHLGLIKTEAQAQRQGAIP